MATVGRTLSILVALCLLGLGIGAWYVYYHYSDPATVRRLLSHWLSQACPKAKIDIGTARASLLHGVTIEDVSLRALENIDQQILTFRSVSVVPDRHRLLEGKLQLKRVLLEGPTLHLHQLANGQWNVAALLTGRKIRFPTAIDVVVRDATIELTSDRTDFVPTKIVGVNGTVALRPEGEARFQLEGQNDLVRRFSLAGRADFVSQTLEIDARSKESIDLAETAERLPEATREKLKAIKDLRGVVDLHVTGRAKKLHDGFDWDGSIEGECRHTAFDHAKLPYPVRDARGQFVASREGFTCSNLKFSLGAAQGNLTVQLPAWDQNRVAAEGKLEGVELTAAVRRVLDDRARGLWDRFEPTGFVDIAGRLIRLGDELALAGEARLHDGTLRFDKFPYPVEAVAGDVQLKDDGSMVYRMTGKAGTGDVEIVGEMEGAPAPAGIAITVKGTGITLDDQFLRALTTPTAQVVRDLRPGVTQGDFVCEVRRPRGSQRYSYTIDADLRSSEATFVGFPYRVTDVTGHLFVEPGKVEFSHFKGRSGDGVIDVNGTVWNQTQGNHTEVGIRAQRIPVDEKLRRALPPAGLSAMNALQATGRANVICNVVQSPGQPLYIELEVDPAETVITPVAFPYRLDRFDGRVLYRDGQVLWNTLSAYHDNVKLDCSGSFVGNDAGGTLEVRNLRSESLVYDDGLRAAAPPSLRATLDFLQPNQPVGIHFPTVKMTWKTGPARDWVIDLDGGIVLKDASLMPAVGLEKVTGELWYRGTCTNDVPHFDGNIRLATATTEGFTATDVQSSFHVDGNRIELPNLRGIMYDGQLHGSIRAEAGKDGKYECRLNLYGAKLREYMLARRSPGSADGMVYLDVFLEGDSNAVDQIRGRGKLDILEADIDRVPMLQDLFRIGNLQPPCGRAFEEVNCDFRVDNRTVWIETLDLLGPASIVGPSFNLFSDGEGSLNINTWELDLAVSARWGRGRIRVPVLTPSFNLASDQVFSFNVRGTLDKPAITPAPLKGFMNFFGGDTEYARRRLSR